MEMEKYEHGVPSWVDIGVADLEQAAAFYSGLFGWECPPGPEEAGGYRVCMLKGLPVAGIGPQTNPGPPVWTSYVNVDSADDVAAKVEANGGQVLMPPMDVMTAGRMAIFADPVGAVFGVWQAGEHKGAGIVNEPGAFSWTELVTNDVDASKDFYGKVFGWGAETHGEGAGAYTEWQVNGRSMAGMMQKPPQMPAEIPPHWMVYFTVTDTDATVEKVKSLGGSLVTGPVDIEPGRFAVVSDPAGGMFAVITLNEDHAA
jgi:predicted enzyme related to lactoylglutathione lyase